MEAAWLIYIYLVAGKLLSLMVWVSLAALILYLIFLMFVAINEESEKYKTDKCDHFKNTKKYAAKWHLFVLTFVLFMVAKSLYPNKEDVAIIFGGASLISLAQTEEAQKLPDNVLKAVNVFLGGITEDKE